MKGLLRAAEAKNILMQSGLEQGQLKLIWELCDRNEEGTVSGSGKGFLKRNEWIICLHLITYSKKGWPLPKVLPPELEGFLANYSQMKMQSEQGFGSQSFINMNNSSASFNQSYSQGQPMGAGYQQPTALADSAVIQRATTQPVMPISTNVNSSGSLPNSQVINRAQTLTNSADVTALVSLLERVVKGYEVLGKKYSDETDNFLESLNKLSYEKQSILKEISTEIELLTQEMETSASNKNLIVEEAKAAIDKSKDTSMADGINRLAQALKPEETINESFDLLSKLKTRLESGTFQIKTDPLPERSTFKSPKPIQEPNVSSYNQPKPQPPTNQYTTQSIYTNYREPEEDMFA